ncbi:hypothetical protein REPUB_Repub20aG0101900 [Reevesia pubescens]
MPPNDDALKFNADGVVRGKLGQAGCGGVLRDSLGCIRGLFYGPLTIMDVTVAELISIKNALKLFCSLPLCGQLKFIIELDSKTAVSWINNKLLRPWKEWRSFTVIDLLCKKSWQYVRSCVQRSQWSS